MVSTPCLYIENSGFFDGFLWWPGGETYDPSSSLRLTARPVGFYLAFFIARVFVVVYFNVFR